MTYSIEASITFLQQTTLYSTCHKLPKLRLRRWRQPSKVAAILDAPFCVKCFCLTFFHLSFNLHQTKSVSLQGRGSGLWTSLFYLPLGTASDWLNWSPVAKRTITTEERGSWRIDVVFVLRVFCVLYCRFDLRIWGSHRWAYCLGVTWDTQILISTSP